MLIKQVYNNNVVLVLDAYSKKEYILTGKGIGFQKKKGMLVDVDMVEKKFISDDAGVKKRLMSLVEEIEEKVFEVTAEVIKIIEDYLQEDLFQYIYISLTDHIGFAIKRAKNGMLIRNTFLHEIKRVYKKEYEAGQLAVDYINKSFDINLTDDEAAFIATHIINAYYQGNSSKCDEDMKVLKILKDVLNIIRYYYKIDYRENDLDYDRLVTHIRFFAKRLLSGELSSDDNGDLLDVVKIKYDRAYGCVQKIKVYIKTNYDYDISKDEELYLMIHIDRVTKKLQ
ncbi:MAG: PRD domain-containing protein [Peptostreptococcus sp.]|uniref:BglG family transcription antiterminator LicT n=1 Tax=Peptostreptococcus sp. TaxID=1262 RepID=UPI002FC682E9